MYDIHCHLLPGCDDGPESWDEALDLARALVADGVTTVVATPHGPGSAHSRAYSPATLRDLAAGLRERVQRAKLSLRILLGTEIPFDVGIAHQLGAGALLPYASSRAILLEPPTQRLPATIDQAIFELQVQGHRVVLAHPERVAQVREDPTCLLPLIERGVVMQLTAASLVGLHGEQLRLCAETLLLHDYVHCIASDAHAASGHRGPALSAARERAGLLIGAERATTLFETRPQALLEDGPLNLPEPRPLKNSKARRWLWR